jgi:hypothetical protein
MADWSTVASISTAGGTLVLAIATFASVRSANRSARAAERAVLAGIRPLLIPSRLDGPVEKVGFMDDHWIKVPGGGAVADATPEAVYLAMALRNVGTGIAVLDRWSFVGEREEMMRIEHAAPETFHRLTRDLYIAAGDNGFWQGVFRDPTDPDFERVTEVIEQRRAFLIDVLYADSDGGQRVISRFAILPRSDDGWMASAGRHWNIDRAEPR